VPGNLVTPQAPTAFRYRVPGRSCAGRGGIGKGRNLGNGGKRGKTGRRGKLGKIRIVFVLKTPKPG
jgi:ribosomal protein L15